MSESRTQSTTDVASVDLSFRVQSLPIAKPRQSRRDKFQPSAAVLAYWRWADLVRLVARRAYLGPGLVPHPGPIAFSCTFIFPIPASWPKYKRTKAAAGNVFHTAKPDLDNLIKGIKDPLSGTVWVDDRQVVEYREPLWKRYGRAEAVGAYVDIWFLEGPL